MADQDSTFEITCFADEIASDLESQLNVLDEEGIQYIDLRSVNDTNVLDLPDDTLDEIRQTLNNRGFEVSSIGSPIGKVDITADFDEHLDRFERALSVAEFFDTEYIRLFSYYIPKEENPEDYREEVLHRMRVKTEMAEQRGITLLHENEKDIYGDTPKRCYDIMTSVDSPHLRAIFDPANYVEISVQSYPDALIQQIEYVEFLHIKDGIFGKRGEMRPPGEGDAKIREMLETFQKRGFHGFASLEPHLVDAGPKGGYSGPNAFKGASRALKNILDDIDTSYR